MQRDRAWALQRDQWSPCTIVLRNGAKTSVTFDDDHDGHTLELETEKVTRARPL